MSTENNNGQQQHDEDDDYGDAYEGEEHGGEEGKDRIPAGFHNVRGVEGSGQMGYAATGTEQVSVEVEFFELADKPHATALFYFSEKSQADSVKKLVAMGWDRSDELTGISKNAVRASVKYEMHEGKRRMKVDVFAGGKFEMKNQMDGEQKKSFFARLREVDKQQTSGAPASKGAAGPNGYPADWDKKGAPAKSAGTPPPKGAPRVNL